MSADIPGAMSPPQEEWTKKERTRRTGGVFSLAGRGVPLRALVFSVAALLVPVVGTFTLAGERSGVEDALLWLVALIPAFLLAYYRGWRGVATALAAGMAMLSVTYAGVTALDREVPPLLFFVVVAYLAIGLGIGWVTEMLHRERTEVEDLALTDVLTGLPNRRHGEIFLKHEFAIAERGRPLTVVLFDLDGFKQYNDLHGHQAGDEALAKFGEVLATNTRRMNVSARFGGEEFLTILAGSDERGALVFAERVRASLASTGLTHGSLTVSGGVAAYDPSMGSPDELVAAADLALYQAKEGGRNRIKAFRRPGDLSGDGTGISTQPEGETPAGEELPSHPPAARTRFGEGRWALIVEDDQAVRTMLAAYLKREGFAVVETGDVTEGLRAMGREFDLVITDIRLPGPSGNELVAAVKARWPATQAVVVTGFRDAQVAAEALNAGADHYLFKPFGIPELQGHLVDALMRRDRILADRQERLLLTEEARRRKGEAHEAILGGTRALVRAVEVRDPYTLGHSERVAHYAVALAGGLGSRPRIDLERLFLACELHDLGKIGIPDAILNKEGSLTSDEFDEVRKHPDTGCRILEPLLGDDLILAVTRWHHERWDGLGYPDGLAGDAIPHVARLVALADTLDAMTSTRAYRNRIPWDEAVAHIAEQGGSQFDPELMDLFTSTLPTLREFFTRATQD